MFHDVHILKSEKLPNRHYIGLTNDLHAHLKKHNSGALSHTSPNMTPSSVPSRTSKLRSEFIEKIDAAMLRAARQVAAENKRLGLPLIVRNQKQPRRSPSRKTENRFAANGGDHKG